MNAPAVLHPPAPHLSPRERQVLGRVASGATAAAIAEALHVGPRTIEQYLLRIRTKLGTRNAAHSVAIAIASGLVDGDAIVAVTETLRAWETGQ